MPGSVPSTPIDASVGAGDRDPRRWLVLAICCSALFVVGLDSTAVNLALPSIRRDLGASTAELQWTLDVYVVVVASFLMLAGSTGDRLGRARVFRAGLVVFTTGSLACSLAPNVEALLAARALQAVGGSMLNPVAMSIVRNAFSDPRERARAIGMWGAVFGASLAFGPVVGGALVDAVSWRAIFWINIPVGLVAVVLTLRFVPESRAERARRVDPVGQVLVVLLLASATFGIIEAPAAGWTSVRTLGTLAAAVVLAVLLVGWELRRREPLVDPRFFRSVPFAGASLSAVLAFVGLGGFLFVNAIYLQEARGLSPFVAGLWTLPMAGGIVLLAPIAGRVVGRLGPRIPLVVGGVAAALGALLLTGIGPDAPFGTLAVAYALFGIGFGATNPPITNTAVSGMPAEQAGVAAAVASTSRQVGTALGVAIVGAVAVGTATGPAAVAQATHTGWWILTGCGVATAVLGVVATTGWARGTAARTAGRFAAEPVPAD